MPKQTPKDQKNIFIKKDTYKVFNFKNFLYSTPYASNYDFMQDTENIGKAETEKNINLINDYFFYNNWKKERLNKNNPFMTGLDKSIQKQINRTEQALKNSHIQINIIL